MESHSKQRNAIMKLGEKIKLLRSEKEMTQPELASKAGIEQSYLSKLENEKGTPSFDIINRIAMALETSGIGLIDTLSQSYVEENLSHIPEVAAEYAVIKQRRENALKKRFIASAFFVVIGMGLVYSGSNNVFYPENGYNYYSDGVIRKGETIYQYSENRINEINETNEERDLRLNNNRGRYDRQYLLSTETNVPTFIKDVEGGRRFYNHYKNTEINNIENDFILISGMMLILSGFFAFFYNIRFKP